MQGVPEPDAVQGVPDAGSGQRRIHGFLHGGRHGIETPGPLDGVDNGIQRSQGMHTGQRYHNGPVQTGADVGRRPSVPGRRPSPGDGTMS
jgi:hypothetical protein